MRQRRHWDRISNRRPECSHCVAASDLGHSGDPRVARYGVMGGGHGQKVGFR
jgi:hypothetical protein